MLDPATLYVVNNDPFPTVYARTPDGIGCYWYENDQKAEAMEDVCDVAHTLTFYSHEEFDQHRYGD